MKVIDASYEILTPISEGGIEELKLIERIGRIPYKSEDKITDDGESAKAFVKMIIDRGHEAVIEHSFLSVLFICDRGISHELVRHRLASFAQESTRYCNYGKSKYHDGVTFIRPSFYKEGSPDMKEWELSCADSEFWYLQALKRGATPQMARSVLNHSLKTEVVMSANYREWRNVLRLRTGSGSHPQMKELMIPLLHELQKKIPIVFDDI